MANVTAVEQPPATTTLNPARGLAQLIGASAWWTASIFLSAGRLDWMRGWISVVLWVTGMTTIGVVGYRFNPAVMNARAQRHRKDTKQFDKIFWAVYLPLVFIQPAVAGLDVERFGWSSIPLGLVYPGAIAFVLGIVLIAWVLRVNPFAEATVRIQTDRDQTVVTSGPYRFVRHPMYIGAFLMYLGMPLVLGSVGALIIGISIVALMIWRTSREDLALRQELPGYEEFTKRTRYRLLPGVW
jgi:protein-S-isoprenylcysteine O-methyltransferase Ste14